MLVRNAKVFTGEGEDDFASAFRIAAGRFVWVGTESDAPAPGPGEEVLDLGGATVLPGLLDVHTHPAMMAGLVDSVLVLPPAVSSIEELIATLRTSSRLGAGPDVWVDAFGYDESRYPEGRPPTRQDLDRVTQTQPLVVRRCDAHSAVVNTLALRLAGITRDTPDPVGAEIGRDADGEPDGRLLEMGAMELVTHLRPTPDRSRWVDRVSRLGRHFRDLGIVAVGDLLATVAPEPLATFREAAGRAWLPRVGLYPLWADISADPPVLTDADRTSDIFIAGCKVLMDGAYSNATAWTHEPYPGSCDHGIRTTSPEDLRAAVAWARNNGVQLACHAMGDAAIDAVIDEFADEAGWLGDVPSIRIEHATLFSPERIARVRDARMDFAVVSHTIFFHAEYEAYERNLFAAQLEQAYPIRSFHEQIPRTALSSDAPATAHAEADNVFVSVQAAVTRRAWNGADFGQAEAVTVPQALLLYTSRAASCMRLPGLGRIADGYEATFVVLDRDVFSQAPDKISATRVDQMWVRGGLVQAAAPSTSTLSAHQEQ